MASHVKEHLDLRPAYKQKAPLNIKPRHKHVTLDFETKSRTPIAKGSWLYSKCPTTEVMCLVYRVDDGPKRLWHPAYPDLFLDEPDTLQELFDAIAEGATLEAHNAFFERCIWENVCVPRMGWPEVKPRQWRCSAAKASAHALPRALEDACISMRMPIKKDMVGNKMMKLLSKPHKPKGKGTKGMPAEFVVPTLDQLRILWDYCGTDVDAEHELSKRLDDLTPLEQEIWFMDQEVNFRGVHVDVELAQVALLLAGQIRLKNNEAFAQITGLNTTGQRDRFIEWCQARGFDLPNTKAETLDEILANPDIEMDDDVREAIRLVRQSGRTSTRKYDTIKKLADEDDHRIRGTIVYCGAERTGRWAGRGIQPHNFAKGFKKDMDEVCQLILTSDLEWLEALYEDVMMLLSHATRGAITASPGRLLYVADFAAIEARVIFWLAGQEDALAILKSGECIYCDMATDIYERKVVKGVHDAERNVGKQAILGLGFGMGGPKFVTTCAKYQIIIQDEFADGVVKKYRKKYTMIPKYWRLQEESAIEAMLNPGKAVDAGDERVKVTWRYDGDFFLRCTLPSGRSLVYPEAKLTKSMTYYFKSLSSQGAERWITVNNDDVEKGMYTDAKILKLARLKATKSGAKLLSDQFFSKENYKLKYKGINPDTKKWDWVHTYSGKLVENIVQGVARDLMAEAMLRAHRHERYDVVLSVHDELVAEEDPDVGDLHEYEQLMAETPAWAEGCPVGAEGWAGFRYRK